VVYAGLGWTADQAGMDFLAGVEASMNEVERGALIGTAAEVAEALAPYRGVDVLIGRIGYDLPGPEVVAGADEPDRHRVGATVGRSQRFWASRRGGFAVRVGVVLPDPPAMVDAAVQAEAAGIFAVLVEGPPGTELVRAATVAAATHYIRVAVRLDLGADDPVTLAEEVAVVDNLANGRLAVVADGVPAETQALFRAALAGRTCAACASSRCPPSPRFRCGPHRPSPTSPR
jgi:alkanesulfonate monooxygenase SsuD/methylene tetrahydromethanopterin reductase-like flavin-dependent oxidoreductase (luciferase family)